MQSNDFMYVITNPLAARGSAVSCRPDCAFFAPLYHAVLGVALAVGSVSGQSFQGPAGANYAGVVTNFGVTGTNVGIAIIEHPSSGVGIKPDHHLGSRLFGQWNFDGLTPPAEPLPQTPPLDGCFNPPPAIASGTSDHATLVANLAAGGAFGSYIGVAPGARVVGGHIDAATDFTGGYNSSRAAIYWTWQHAVEIGLSNGVWVYNLSYGYPGNDNGDNALALFLDWFGAGEPPGLFTAVLLVVSAGNDSSLIRKPADLFNGITVGATDAGLQRRLEFSGYVLSPDARSKPDILAPGSNVSDGNDTSTGASFAAPQVSGTAALLAGYGLTNVGGYFSATTRAIILNSARKRFISGENSTNGISKDAIATANEATDYDYVDGTLLRTGGSGSGPKTEDWTPAAWTNSGGVFNTTRPLDDEQGAGLLDVKRALAQMGGPGLSGQYPPGPVPPIGWSIYFLYPGPPPPATLTQEYPLDFPISAGSFVTATLCWGRPVVENNSPVLNPGTCSVTTNPAPYQVDVYDTYYPTNFINLALRLYHGTNLIAESVSLVDNLQHLHVPVPADGTNGDYRITADWISGPSYGVHYSLAWWAGSPPPMTNQLSLDFGDAPDPTYPTLLANNGARHVVVPGIFLGTNLDAELDGQPNAIATGDDLAASDDEDGVTFLTLLTPGSNATVLVVASTNGLLNAWMDFNANGSWTNAGEQIFTNQPLVAGANLLTVAVPVASSSGTNIFARFRFSSAGGLSYTGPALDGEVEDYAVTITCPPPVIFSLTRGASGTATKIVFTTRAGCNYTVEYKNSLNDTSWTVVDTVAGTGDTVTVLDSTASVATRYYRVRTQ